MNDDITDLVALLDGQIAKPGGDEYLNTMVGPGAWPEFDESVFDQRKEALSYLKSAVTQAHANWDAVHAKVFNGLFVWFGGGASAAAAKAEQHSKAMEQLEKQLAAAIEWSAKAWLTTRNAKKAIADFVWLTHKAITDLLNKDYEDETEKKDAENAAKKMAEQAYLANKQFLDNLADSLSGKTQQDGSLPPGNHAAAPLDNSGTEGTVSASGGGAADSSNPSSASLMSNEGKGQPQSDEGVPAGREGANKADKGDVPGADKDDDATESRASTFAPRGSEAAAPGSDKDEADTQSRSSTVAPSGNEAAAPGSDKSDADTQAGVSPATPATVLPNPIQSAPGPKSPTGPVSPSIPSAPSAPSAPSTSSAASAASSLSSGGSPASSAASAGIDPSKAAGQAPVGGAPTDPLQAFSNGFADSAGTPVHAASSGGAPPPLAPSPVVPASDAMTPASTGSVPLTQTGAQAPAAPVQTPASGGPMGGMGMGGMPLGPPPTAPPAAPVAPPAAPPPTVAPPPNIAGGAQVAPIPVSAARAERDAAQNAAKRSGSDPLVLARRIAAALCAPDMVNEKKDPLFHWITAVTQEGRIVVANNYALAYIPEQVRLPEHVVMASADESIPPSERARWATYPVMAVQGWAQHHDTKLRALVGFEHQFASDSGLHIELLTDEDIPASGKMAGRDRLQIIAPEVSSRLARIGDMDLVKLLPPAPVDTTPPDEGHRLESWEKVWERVISRSATRGEPQLEAFLAYASCAQESALFEAHQAPDAHAQRRAVEGFIYWQHVGQLTADALER